MKEKIIDYIFIDGRSANPEKVLEYARRWQAHLEKVREYTKRWRKNNPEKVKESAKRW